MSRFYKDGMFGLIVGDAVGMPVQFEERLLIKADPVTDMLDHLCFDMPKGAWTDDSSLALATLYSIKEQGKLDIEDVAKKFAMWITDGLFTPLGFAYDVGTGCMNAIYKFIQTLDVHNCGGKTEEDNGNGSLMRILPTCIYAYEELTAGKISESEAIALVESSSAITHAHKRAKTACVIYFYIVKEIIDSHNTNEVKSLFELIENAIAKTRSYALVHIDTFKEYSKFHRLFALQTFKDLPEDEIYSTGYVLHSLEAAIWSLLNTDNYRDCILKAVNLGDDTDTIAAIAGGLAGLYYGYDGIPAEWLDSIMKKKWIEELCDFNNPLVNEEDWRLFDCHCHILPNVDDGSLSNEMSIEMLEIARNNGITDIFCTPHSWAIIEHDDNYNVLDDFNRFKELANKAVPEVNLYPGCELLFDFYVAEEDVLSVKSNEFPAYNLKKHVLVEFWHDITPEKAIETVKFVLSKGYIPVLAHIERYPSLFDTDNFYKRIDDSVIRALIDEGAYIQVNISSLYTVYDKEWNSLSRHLLHSGLIHFLGTDSHRSNMRTPEIDENLAYIYMTCDKEYAKDICYRNAIKWLI